jgi:hypothetical protein
MAESIIPEISDFSVGENEDQSKITNDFKNAGKTYGVLRNHKLSDVNGIPRYTKSRAMGSEQEYGIITKCVDESHRKQVCDMCWEWKNLSRFHRTKIFGD